MRLFLADDAALIREGLGGILERTGHEIVGQAENAEQLLMRMRALLGAGEQIDILVTDVRMPPTMSDDGLRAAVELRREFPQLSVMILSQYVAPAYASVLFDRGDTGGNHAMGAVASSAGSGAACGGVSLFATGSGRGSASPYYPQGGLGYLLKDRVSRVADFVRSLTIVAAGGVVVDPEVAAGLVQAKHTALAGLSPREREVLELMAQGYSNSDIATRLYLSGAAVSKHVANVFLKLGLEPGEENRRVRAVLTYLTAKGYV